MFLAFTMSLEISRGGNYRCGRALAKVPIDSAVVEDLKANEEQHCDADRFEENGLPPQLG